jgi:small subunit ribosomal protein S1
VVNVTDFGLFVDIFEGLEGLAHVSEIDVEGGSLEDEYQLGDWVSARILRIEDEERKVGLTMRGVDQPSEEERVELQSARDTAQRAAEMAALEQASDSDDDEAGDADPSEGDSEEE